MTTRDKEQQNYARDPTCPFLSHKLPPDLNEVDYVISKVHKYGNIDDYAEKLIREDIERRRRRNNTDDLFKEYLKKILPSSCSDDLDEYEEEIPITLRLKKNVAQVGRLIAKHYGEDFEKFVSEEISKIIYTLSDSSSLILSPPPISDELKQHIQSLLKEGEEKKKN